MVGPGGWSGGSLSLQFSPVSIWEATFRGHWLVWAAAVGTETKTGLQWNTAARGLGCSVRPPQQELIWAGLVPPVALVLLSWTQGSGGSSSGEGWPPWPEDICPELWEGWEAGAPGAGEDTGCTVPLHPACRP